MLERLRKKLFYILPKAFKDLQNYKDGKLKTTSAKAFIDELLK